VSMARLMEAFHHLLQSRCVLSTKITHSMARLMEAFHRLLQSRCVLSTKITHSLVSYVLLDINTLYCSNLYIFSLGAHKKESRPKHVTIQALINLSFKVSPFRILVCSRNSSRISVRSSATLLFVLKAADE